MTSNLKLTLLSGVAAAAVTVMAAGTANATNGMLPHCVGTVKCGKGGAGSARAEAAVDAAINPALAAKMGNSYQINVGWFWADVKGLSTAGGSTEMKSGADNFPNGSFGVNYRLDDSSAFNISVVPGGGGASEWPISRTATNFGGQLGTAATDDQHVNYEMLYVQPTYAKTIGNASYGIGAIISRATMDTDSVNGGFAPGTWADTNETFYGVGFQVGGVWDLTDVGSVALNLRSPVWHQNSGVYDGNVFTDPIDTPMQFQAGVSVDATQDVTVDFDVKWVGWSSTATIGNQPNDTPSTSRGFGWDDQVILALGVDYDVNEALTLRAGINHGNSPIDSGHVLANFLFPAIVETHYTVGGSYDLGNGMQVGASAYITENATEMDDGSMFGTSGSTGTYLEHKQKGFQISFSNDF